MGLGTRRFKGATLEFNFFSPPGWVLVTLSRLGAHKRCAPFQRNVKSPLYRSVFVAPLRREQPFLRRAERGACGEWCEATFKISGRDS